MKLLEPGAVVDGFVVRECIHAGGMAHIYRVEYASGAPDPGFRGVGHRHGAVEMIRMNPEQRRVCGAR